MTRREGFTLLELLAAVTITVLLVGLILAVTTGVLNLWRRTQGGFSTNAEAKLTLDFLERDLQSALYRADGNAWLAVDVATASSALSNRGWLTSPAMKPASESLRVLPDVDASEMRHIRDARFGLAGAWLRFIATNVERYESDQAEPPKGSLPVALAYQIARRPISGLIGSTNRAPIRYTLFRVTVSAGNTFSSGYSILADNYASSSNTPASQRSASTIANPTNADALASNVIDVGVWLYARQSDGSLRRIFPLTTADLGHAARNGGDEMPVVADVMLRILTEEGATLIDSIESGRLARPSQHATDGEWWWAVAEAHSRVYTRRVEIKGGAL